MKVGKSERATQAYRAGGTRAAGQASSVAAASSVASIAPVSATVLGIPEQEFTPSVRNAIMTLMGEVDRLRQDAADTRSRLEEMALAADQDMMLPVLNRRAFVRETTRFIAVATRYGTPSSLLYFDLDDFKLVNDTYGHAAGDAALVHFADVLLQQVRDTDVVGRLGGDEFGVVLSHVSLDQALRKGESLAQALREAPPNWQGKEIDLKFSFGAYELKAGENADTAMAQADQAMYEHKRGTRQ